MAPRHSKATKANSKVKHSRGPQVYQPTTSETIVTLNQSLDLLRVAVTASISAITWSRGVFPNECYELRFIDKADHSSSYDTFVKGKTGWVDSDGEGYSWRLLARGTGNGVDKVLDWLEIGVKEALEKGYLASLQFSFYEGKVVSPDALIEAYTITFTYVDGNASVQLNKKSRNENNPNGKTIVLFDAKEGMRRLMDNNYYTATDMNDAVPRLPENRVADMHLTYTDASPKGYNAPGFKTCSDARLLVAIPDNARVNYADLGHHKLQVDLYNKFVTPSLPCKIAEQHARDFAQNPESLAIAQQSPPTTINPLSRRRQISQSSEVDGNTTQEIGVRSFTSIGVCRNPTDTQDTHSLQPAVATTHTVNGTWLPYTQTVLDRISKERSGECGTHASAVPEIQEIQCECLSSTDENNLVQCHTCKKLQHVQCYGYLEDTIPVELLANFICYSCLLNGENPLLIKMRRLCLLRRAICFLRGKGELDDQAVLGKHLNRKKGEVTRVLNELQAAGLISRRVLKKGRHPAHFTFLDKIQTIRRDYFNPQLDIAHHFELPEESPSEFTLRALDQMYSIVQPGHQASVMSTQQSREGQGMNSVQLPTRLEGSSTQGTPSPRAPTRYMSTPNRRTSGTSDIATPKSTTYDLRRTIANKRVAEFAPEEARPFKRVEMSSTDSPMK